VVYADKTGDIEKVIDSKVKVMEDVFKNAFNWFRCVIGASTILGKMGSKVKGEGDEVF